MGVQVDEEEGACFPFAPVAGRLRFMGNASSYNFNVSCFVLVWDSLLAEPANQQAVNKEMRIIKITRNPKIGIYLMTLWAIKIYADNMPS